MGKEKYLNYYNFIAVRFCKGYRYRVIIFPNGLNNFHFIFVNEIFTVPFDRRNRNMYLKRCCFFCRCITKSLDCFSNSVCGRSTCIA